MTGVSLMSSHGFQRAAVVGAGLMGRRIAAVFAADGLPVSLYDTDPAVLAGAASPGVTRADDLAQAVRDADFVTEAVTEDLAVKQDLFAEREAAPRSAPAASGKAELARMGPLENADYVGLDLTLAIHHAVFPALCASSEPAEVLRQLVLNKDLGAKTGRGFMDWPPGAREAAARALEEYVRAQLDGGER
jgi:3-hydroxyacyl-CoA dehydrogenase